VEHFQSAKPWDTLAFPFPPTYISNQLLESSMAVNYWGKGAIELHDADCGHTMFIPPGHTADHQHCYTCHPELAKEPLAGCCEDCRIKRERELHRTVENA
jgi:hypothetical protein